MALTPGKLDGKVLDLTGPELLGYADAVQKLGRALKRDLAFADVPASAWHETMLNAGAPRELVAAAGRWYAAVKAHQMTVSPTVADVLGHTGQTFDAWLADGGATRARGS